jgi:surface antigen
VAPSRLQGIIGGLLGNQIGSWSGRAVATVGGAVVGVLIGREIGRRIDARDQACIGQALEYAPPGHRVEWSGGSRTYAVVPGSVTTSNGRYCRSYEAEVMTEQGPQRVPGVSCRRSDGSWQAAGQAR